MKTLRILKIDYQHDYNLESESCTVIAVALDDKDRAVNLELVFEDDTIYSLLGQLELYLPHDAEAEDELDAIMREHPGVYEFIRGK